MSHPRHKANRFRLAVTLVLLFTGALFASSAGNSRGQDLRPSSSTDLVDLIRAQSLETRTLSERADRLRKDVDRLTASGSTDPALEQQLERLSSVVGLTPLQGPGLTVQLDDAPLPPDGMPVSGTTYDDYVIHQQDVEGVMNALWRGGAEAMSVMDQRIISTSAVRCVGNVLILNGQVFSPPYEIRAIGDPAELSRALTNEPAVVTYLQWVERLGLGYKVTRHKVTTVPPYQGSIDLQHVTEQAG
jgi:uncharacterized protein YlxW (UPF0749 family)